MTKYFYDTEFAEQPGKMELISIGMVSEDGREFYAVSTEFNPENCNAWVKANVLPKLPTKTLYTDEDSVWMNREKLKVKLMNFIGADSRRPEFWTYFGAYDHVNLAWIFGGMMDFPQGYPMFSHDIMQLWSSIGYRGNLPAKPDNLHDALADARWTKQAYEYLVKHSTKLMVNGLISRGSIDKE